MLRHHRHGEIQMAEEKTIQRRHSHHGHLSLKPASVIDHLKTKVKRKRLSKHDLSESSDGASNQMINGNLNNNNNNKKSSQDHVEPLPKIFLAPAQSHPTILSTTLSNKYLHDENAIEDNDKNDVFIEKDEEDSVVPNDINEYEDLEENSSWQRNRLSSDMNQKMNRLKPKSIKATKPFHDTNNQTNAKKRRQTVRRTGFQIRDEDFSVIFSDLPSDEKLIIAYPCAWRRDVFMHGRMFLSVNYLSFYTCFFKWEESVCIAYKDIISVTREKSVKVVPNAIKLRTKNQEQYIFASYIPREKIFIAIFRLWQNALLEQPLDYQQLRAIIYADQQSHDESSGDSEESIVLENNGEYALEPGLYSQSLPLTSDRSTESSTRLELPVRARRVVSLPPDNEIITYLPTCTCETHLAKTYADRLFTFNVDTLFELICGDNSFTRSFHNSQKLNDYTYGEWHLNNETGKRERQVTYKTITQSILGTNSLFCREKQILEVEKPHVMYILNTEVYNEGMKYTDAFYVATRFCMVQRDAEYSSLKVTGEIKYVKNVNGFIKTFIEKNANASIEIGVNEQVQRLENQQVTQINRKSNEKRIPISKQRIKESIDNNNRSRKQTEENSSENSVILSESKISIKEKTITGKHIFYDIALLIGIFLLLLHIYLCYQLYSIDQILLTPDGICLNQCKKTCLENIIHR